MEYRRFLLRTRKLRFLSGFLLAMSLITWTAAYAQITPSADAYTDSADPTTNYGASALLYVNGTLSTTYIQFNLASIPSGASVSQATLKLYANTVVTAGSFNVDYVNGSWTESTITHNLAPATGSTIAADVALTTADKNQYILINVTSAVQAWLSGSEPNDGFVLVANGTFDASFDSKENTGTSHPAELDIAYAGGDGTITGVTTASGSGLIGGGTSGTLDLSLTNACAAGQVLQWSGSAWACGNPGTGTITGVTAGTDLTGGGTSGNVTLNLNTSNVPQLNSTNTFSALNTFTSSLGVGDPSAPPPGPLPAGLLQVVSDTDVIAGWFEDSLADNPTVYMYNAAPSSDVAYALQAGGSVGYCTINIQGDLKCTGSKSAVVPVDGGSRKVALYAVEAPENWFEDFGSGRLSNGSVRIDLESTFAQTVNTDLDYHVFLTPNGECKGLYVSQKGPNSFEVHELGSGTSSVAFDYRIVAKRKNYENVRLAGFSEPFKKSAGRQHPARQSKQMGFTPASNSAMTPQQYPGAGPVNKAQARPMQSTAPVHGSTK